MQWGGHPQDQLTVGLLNTLQQDNERQAIHTFVNGRVKGGCPWGDPEGAKAAMKGHCERRVSLGQHLALRVTMGTNSLLVFIQDGPSVQHKMMPQLQRAARKGDR